VTVRLPSVLDSGLQRLRAGDLPQFGLLVLALMVATLVVTWPARPGLPNESWYAVSQTRSVLVALLALGYGMGLPLASPRQAAATALAVLLLAITTLPLELVAHAGSAPATPVWWAWLATPVATAGHLALGGLLGVLVRRLRLTALAPLLAPAVLVGAVAIDVRLGVTLLNPLTAALQVAPGHLAFHGTAAVVGAVALAWAARRRGGAA
jgi:hypothetical protein